MNSYPSVAIVILTYNAEAIIECCLRSFAELSYPNASFLVVDNNSHDATAQIVRGKFPGFRLQVANENDGYTGGNNLGLELALQADAAYVLVVNPDTILHNTEFVTEMVRYLEKHPRVGIAGPRVFLRASDCVQNTILFPPGLWRNIVHWVRYRWNPQFAQLSGDAPLTAEMLNGVCVLLRAECLQQIGLFDESIFMYIEDADLAYRARLADWQIHYLPIDSVIHEQKEEGYHETGFVAWLLKRNSVYYLMKISRCAEAWGYASLSLSLFAFKLFLQSPRRDYASFIYQLMTGYLSALSGSAAGRPFARQVILKQAARS